MNRGILMIVAGSLLGLAGCSDNDSRAGTGIGATSGRGGSGSDQGGSEVGPHSGGAAGGTSPAPR